MSLEYTVSMLYLIIGSSLIRRRSWDFLTESDAPALPIFEPQRLHTSLPLLEAYSIWWKTSTCTQGIQVLTEGRHHADVERLATISSHYA